MAKFVIGLDGPICGGKSEFLNYLSAHEDAFAQFLGENEKVVTEPEFIDGKSLQLFYLMHRDLELEIRERSRKVFGETCLEDGEYNPERLGRYMELQAKLHHELRSYPTDEDRKIFTILFEKSCLAGRQVRYTTAKFSPDIYIFDKTMIGGAESYCRNSFESGDLPWENYRRYTEDLRRGLDALGRDKQEQWLEQLIVYFKVNDYHTVQERLAARDTAGEKVPQKYWEGVNKWCEHTFLNPGPQESYTKYGVNPPEVLEVNGSTNLQENPNFHSQVIEQIIGRLIKMGLRK